MRAEAAGSARRNQGRERCTGASSATLPASTNCIIARAVKDFVSEASRKGVCGVIGRPWKASPKPCKETIWVPWTRPRASPGIRFACISEIMNALILATSGEPVGDADATESVVSGNTSSTSKQEKTRMTMVRCKLIFMIHSFRWKDRSIALHITGSLLAYKKSRTKERDLFPQR